MPKRLRIFRLSKSRPHAFTLVEVLVSVSLFIMALIAISQVYISVVRSEKVAYSLLNSENNIRNNMESMARSLRLGKNFEILDDGHGICFDYYSENSWQNVCYRFNEDEQTLEKSANGEYMAVLDPQLKVNYMRFYVKNGSSDEQSSVSIVWEVATYVKDQEYTFNLQTAVTPRYLGL